MSKPIQQRIFDAFTSVGGRRMSYRELAHAVFPPEQYPKAWNYRVSGGPPGCYMALSAAIRRMKLYVSWHEERYVYPPRQPAQPQEPKR